MVRTPEFSSGAGCKDSIARQPPMPAPLLQRTVPRMPCDTHGLTTTSPAGPRKENLQTIQDVSAQDTFAADKLIGNWLLRARRYSALRGRGRIGVARQPLRTESAWGGQNVK